MPAKAWTPCREGTDAAPLAPTAAQEGIEAETEGDEPGYGEEQACG